MAIGKKTADFAGWAKRGMPIGAAPVLPSSSRRGFSRDPAVTIVDQGLLNIERGIGLADFCAISQLPPGHGGSVVVLDFDMQDEFTAFSPHVCNQIGSAVSMV